MFYSHIYLEWNKQIATIYGHYGKWCVFRFPGVARARRVMWSWKCLKPSRIMLIFLEIYRNGIQKCFQTKQRKDLNHLPLAWNHVNRAMQFSMWRHVCWLPWFFIVEHCYCHEHDIAIRHEQTVCLPNILAYRLVIMMTWSFFIP